MKKVTGIAITNASVNENGIVSASIGITGSVKEAEVNPKWIENKLAYTVTVRATLAEVLELYGADLRIAIAGRLRKCSGEFVAGMRGQTYSLAGLDALIDAATPETSGTGAKANVAKMREMLRGMGMTDEEIDSKLASM
jgi:hypothetical protein